MNLNFLFGFIIIIVGGGAARVALRSMLENEIFMKDSDVVLGF